MQLYITSTLILKNHEHKVPKIIEEEPSIADDHLWRKLTTLFHEMSRLKTRQKYILRERENRRIEREEM